MAKYWAESDGYGSMICKVKIVESMGILYEIEILKIFAITGEYKNDDEWEVGSITSTGDDFIFDDNDHRLIEYILDEMVV